MLAVCRKAILVAAWAVYAHGQQTSVKLVNLTVEHLLSPVGVNTVQPRFSWHLASTQPLRAVTQTAYMLNISSTLSACTSGTGDVWSSGLIPSQQSVLVAANSSTSAAGLLAGQQYYWTVAVQTSNSPGTPSAPAECQSFSVGLQSASDWSSDSAFVGQASSDISAAPWLRTAFTLTAADFSMVRSGQASALLHVASAGYHEPYLNGQRIDPTSVLLPAVANLGRVIPARSYDVASLLVQGQNVLGLWLGPGWANYSTSPVTFNLTKAPIARAELRITPAVSVSPGQYKGGASVLIATNTSWKVSASTTSHMGQWENSNFGGDRVDYTAVPQALWSSNGWASASVDDSTWEGATEYQLNRILRPEHLEPPSILGTVPAASVSSTPCPAGSTSVPGTACYLVTMSELYTGWFSMSSVPAAPGAAVTLYYSTNNGTLIEYNMQDQVICPSDGSVCAFSARFSYHEIQFVTLTNLSSAPTMSSMSGIRLMSVRARDGYTTSSNALLNTIYENTIRTYEGLTIGMTVDCPHRERLGYGGDAHTSMETAMDTWSSGAFFAKVAQDWADVQGWDGTDDLPHTAPTISGGGGPGWGGYIVLMPWELYQRTGDSRPLIAAWPHTVRFLNFLAASVNTSTGLLMPIRGLAGYWGFLGDWVTPHGSENSGTPESILFNNAYFVYCLKTAARIAAVVGDSTNGPLFSQLAQSMGTATHAAFYNPGVGHWLDARQTHNLMPLVATLVPPALTPIALQALVDSVLLNASGHFDTGLHGTYFLTRYLTDPDSLSLSPPGTPSSLPLGAQATVAGPGAELLYTLLTQESAPSYQDMIVKGYTTWPEYWGGSGSRMHGCLNGIGLWFTQGLLGVRRDPDAPGMQSFIIRPAYGVGNTTWASGTVHSVYGPVAVAWNTGPGSSRDSEAGAPVVSMTGAASRTVMAYTLNITIPHNTAATVWIPASSDSAVTEGGQPAGQAPGVTYAGLVTPYLNSPVTLTLWRVGSGSYAFASVL